MDRPKTMAIAAWCALLAAAPALAQGPAGDGSPRGGGAPGGGGGAPGAADARPRWLVVLLLVAAVLLVFRFVSRGRRRAIR